MIFIGDTHGNHAHIRWVIKQKKMIDQQLIHVGDFGVGFTNNENEIKNLTFFNDFLKERNIILHVFRGNHDDPQYFKGEYLYSNLKLHPDYTVLDIEDKRILGIGGAVSIDRVPRRLEDKIVWWEDEIFVLNKEFLNEVRNIDIVVTHTAPKHIAPINVPGNWPQIVKHFAKNDDKLYDDLILERDLLAEAFELLQANNNITHHFYGHFHMNIVTPMDGCIHSCLDINEFFELPDYSAYEEELNEKYSK